MLDRVRLKPWHIKLIFPPSFLSLCCTRVVLTLAPASLVCVCGVFSRLSQQHDPQNISNIHTLILLRHGHLAFPNLHTCTHTPQNLCPGCRDRNNNAAFDTDPNLQSIPPPPPKALIALPRPPGLALATGPRMRFRCRTLLFPISGV